MLSVLDRLAELDVRVVVVYLQAPDEAAKAAISAKAKVDFVSDLGGRIHKALNAAFIPRVYVYDSNLRLIWKQDSPSLKEVEDYAKR